MSSICLDLPECICEYVYGDPYQEFNHCGWCPCVTGIKHVDYAKLWKSLAKDLLIRLNDMTDQRDCLAFQLNVLDRNQ